MAKNIKFDTNEEAVGLLDNLKGSIENKIRTAYNLGYKEGLTDGKIEAIQSVYSWLFENDHKNESQTCDTCRFDSRYGIESICTECSRHYSDCYAPTDEQSGKE